MLFFYKHGDFQIQLSPCLFFSQIQLSFMLSPCLFFSQIQLSHAQPMLIFSKNLAQPCLFLTCFETKPEKNAFLARILPILGKIQPCHAYFLLKSSLAMLRSCLYIFQIQLSHAQSMLIFFKSSLAMLIFHSLHTTLSINSHYVKYFYFQI